MRASGLAAAAGMPATSLSAGFRRDRELAVFNVFEIPLTSEKNS
jgi:hypothetical protein